VRTAMIAALNDHSPPEPRFANVSERVDWLSKMSERLPRKWKPELQQRLDFLKTIRYEAGRAGLDPHLVLGLVEVESNFRRYAVSNVGARGYMQVMPFWSRLLSDGDDSKLFDIRTNLRYGCLILRHYLDIEKGDLFRALGRYNGSLGRPDYPMAVLRAWKKWQYNGAGTAVQQARAPDTDAPAQLSAISARTSAPAEPVLQR
jgi:soluble lytic murein transglycosylase-like protein